MRMLTVDQAAKELHVAPRHVRYLIDRGGVRIARIASRSGGPFTTSILVAADDLYESILTRGITNAR